MTKKFFFLPLVFLFLILNSFGQSSRFSDVKFAFNARISDADFPSLPGSEQAKSQSPANPSLTLLPIADAFIRNGTYATKNYGSDPSLMVKGTASKDLARSSYLKFSLNSVSSISSAKLRVYGKNGEAATSINMAAYGVNDDTWSETSITWTNAPAAASTTALSSVGVTNVSQYYELDVTSFVQAQFAGDKTVSFLLKNPSNQNNNLLLNSKENSANRPQLVISMNNNSPVLATIGNQTATVGQPIAFTASATDLDAGQSLAYSLASAPTGSTATIDPTSGTFSWTPTTSGNFNFTVRVTDNGSPALYDDEAIIISVSDPVNHAPVLAPIGNKSATVLQPFTFTASASDQDAGQKLTYSLSSAPAGCTATIDGNSGVFNWTPAATGDSVFTIRVTDNGSPVQYSEETITVSVSAPNQSPVLTSIGSRSASTGMAFTITATASDPDPNQTLTYSLTGTPGGATIDPISGVFNWIPAASGDSVFTIRVTDNGSPALYDEETITITVTDPPNQSPVLGPLPNRNAMVGQLLTFTVTATDPNTRQNLSFSLVDPSPASATIDAATGVFNWTPTSETEGNIPVTVRVTDNGSPVLSDQKQFIAIVAEPNRAPVLTTIGDQSITIGQTLTFTANVTDPDAGQTENFYLIDAPDGAVIDASTGSFSWTPAQTGKFTFTVHVSDDGEPALSDEETITVTVNEVNQAPVLAAIGNKSVNAGQTLTFTAKANDPNVTQTETFSLIGEPNGAVINAASGAFSWTPGANTSGAYTFKVRVTDNGSPVLYDEEQITVTVNNTTVTLSPIADAYIRNGTYAANNYGSDPSLMVKGVTANNGLARSSYLKFSLNGVSNVTYAKLRIYGKNGESAASINMTAYGVNDDSWTELGITWNNAPAAGSSTALSSVGVTNVNQYYELDVTGFVQAQLAGDKTASFLLKDPANLSKNLLLNSKENSANPPQLVISTTGTPPSNHAPVLASIGNKQATLGQPLNFTASATDQDAGQTRNFSLLSGAPGGASIDATSGAFSWTPGATGSFNITIRVTDNGSPVLYDEEQITVTVTGAPTTATFTNTQSISIPNPGTVSVPVTVSGLPTHIDTTAYGLQSINVQVTHPADKELTLQLKSPDGKTIYLFKKSPGVNLNTTFDAVSSKFIDINEIATYTGSFTSGYRPRQDLSLLNNGQNPNGTWNMIIKDDTSASTAGTVTGVTLTFGPSPAKPLLTLSTLPIIKIYTANGVDIPDDPKVLADMYLINNSGGVLNNVNQSTYQYQGKVGIEIRGNSTATDPNIPKRQYGFETRLADGVTSTDVSFFGMAKQSDWILSAVLSDKSLMRNLLTYQLSRDMGWWASHTQFCEVVINDEYRGVFIFEEKIKKDKNRVNIEKMATTDISAPNVQGGYIFSVDDLDPGDITWTTLYPPKPSNPYKFVYPKPEDLQPAQQSYLEKYVGDFETALHGSNFQDPVNGFRKYANDSSFIDYFLLQEVAKNSDAYRYSTYFYKTRFGRIVAGPIWDMDRAYRNEEICNTFLPSGYISTGLADCGRVVPWWWGRLLEDTKFKQDLVCRYNSLRQTTLSLQHIYHIIDSSAAVLNAGAQQRNFIRWNTFGKYVERIPKPYLTSYALEIDTLKRWIGERLAWIDNDLGTCTSQQLSRSESNNIIAESQENTISSVYPSPFKDQLSVNLNVNKEQKVNVKLVDINGRVLYEKETLLQKGPQLIHLDFAKNKLAGGLYILHVNGTNINFNKKVLKE